MNLMIEIMLFLSAGGLGLFVGASLTEAVVLVPMWRSLRPPEFFMLHAAHAHRLYGFFAPLTAAATFLAVAASRTLLASWQGRLEKPHQHWLPGHCERERSDSAVPF